MTLRDQRADRDLYRARVARAELARREKAARSAREDLAVFVRAAWHVLERDGSLEWNWHHDALSEHIQAALEDWKLSGLTPLEVEVWFAAKRTLRTGRGLELLAIAEKHWRETCAGGRYKQRVQDLAVNIGPISLKSRITMVFAPSWMWLDTPDWSVLCASGTPSNVDRDSMASRDLVESEWYRDTFRIEWTIRNDLDRVAKWGTTAGGIRESRGLVGSFTGIHVDGILLDDPDDAAGVYSDSARRDTWMAWLAMGNRLNDIRRPIRIVVQQNLHAEDLTTKLVKLGVPRLSIPIEFSSAERATTFLGWTDPRTTSGELREPGRFPPEVLAAERVRLGSHAFEAQYNCRTSSLDGGMIKRGWWRFFRFEDDPEPLYPRPDGCWTGPAHVIRRNADTRRYMLDAITVSVDCSNSIEANEDSSAVGLEVIGEVAQDVFVIDDRTEVMGILQMYQAIKDVISAYHTGRVLVELKAAGASVIAELRQALAGGKILGPDGTPAIVVVEQITDVKDSKAGRAQAMVPAIEAGHVYVREGARWLHPSPKDRHDVGFIGEQCSFPNAPRNDRVDTLSQFMTWRRKRVRTTPGIPISGDAKIVKAPEGSMWSVLGGINGA